MVCQRAGEDDDDIHSPRRKRLRFATTVGGNLCVHQKESDRFKEDIDKAALWWSRKDRDSFSKACHETIQKFRDDHKDEVDHYLEVFDHCTESPSAASSEYLEQAKIKLPAHVRGLEWGLTPCVRTQRRRHVHEVLDVQDQVQGLNASMRDRLLSSRSLRSSRPCRLMARILGDVDTAELS